MSVQLIEGFESLEVPDAGSSGTRNMASSPTAGWWSNGAYQPGVSGELLNFKDTTGTHFFGACRIYLTNWNRDLFTMDNPSFGNGNSHFQVGINGSGTLFIRDANTTIVGTGSTVIPLGAFFLIEWEVTIGGASPANVWIGGLSTAEIAVTGQDFAYSTYTTSTGFSMRGNSGARFDDIIVYDTQGTVNNSRVGDKVVVGIRPNGIGDTNQWTPEAASTTTFYFPDYTQSDDQSSLIVTGDVNYGPPIAVSPDAEWDITTYASGSGFLKGWLSPFAGGTTPRRKAHNRPSPSATQNQDVLMGQFISPALAAQTISGTIHMQMQVNEESTSVDARSQLIVRVVSADGSTVRGTLYAGDTGALTDEWSTTRQNTTFPQKTISPVTMTNVTCLDGDRIVVEYGWRTHAVAGSNADNREIIGDGGSSGDLPDSEADVTTAQTYNPWIKFSNAISLLASGNWELVNQSPPTDVGAINNGPNNFTPGRYVTTSTDNNDELYALDNPPASMTASGPLVIKVRAQKMDAGTRTLTLRYKTSGVEQSGSAKALGSGAYSNVREYLDVDGTDSAAWTDTKLNSLQAGMRATT